MKFTFWWYHRKISLSATKYINFVVWPFFRSRVSSGWNPPIPCRVATPATSTQLRIYSHNFRKPQFPDIIGIVFRHCMQPKQLQNNDKYPNANVDITLVSMTRTKTMTFIINNLSLLCNWKQCNICNAYPYKCFIIEAWCSKLALVNWVIIGSGNGLAPVWCQAITWTNADSLSICPVGTCFSEIWIKIK